MAVPGELTLEDAELAVASGGLAPARHQRSLGQVIASDDADEELMQRYGAGDAFAFERLYERHRRPLWRFLSRQLGNEATTADVFQEVWTRVIGHRQRYTPRARFTTWMYRIAHNCCVDHWRRSGRRQRREVAGDDDLLESLPHPDALTPVDELIDSEAAARLGAALDELPEEQRAAFLMYVEGGLSIAEIAAAMEIADEGAKSRLRYAVAKLKRALARDPA